MCSLYSPRLRAWFDQQIGWGNPCPPRTFRITTLLTVVFVLNAFDLGFTGAQLPRGNFAEANVVAAMALNWGIGGAVTYKALLLALGAWILYYHRQRRSAEIGAWILAGCHVGLMVWWLVYLDTIELVLADPCVRGFIVPY